MNITIDKAVLEQVLEWFEWFHNGSTIASPASSTQVMRTLREALTQPVQHPVQENEWQPIETAPKDGTEILLSNGETVAQGNWLQAEPCIKEKRDLEGRYIDQDEFDGYDGWIDSVGGMQPDPTHWMPLPHPPSEQAHGITKGTT